MKYTLVAIPTDKFNVVIAHVTKLMLHGYAVPLDVYASMNPAGTVMVTVPPPTVLNLYQTAGALAPHMATLSAYPHVVPANVPPAPVSIAVAQVDDRRQPSSTAPLQLSSTLLPHASGAGTTSPAHAPNAP